MKPTPPVTKMCGMLPVFVRTTAPAHSGCTRALRRLSLASGSHWALKFATLCRALEVGGLQARAKKLLEC